MGYRFTLRAARAYSDLSLQEAAEKLGVSYSTLRNWEIGKTEPKATQLHQMSELYGIRTEDFFLSSKSIQN